MSAAISIVVAVAVVVVCLWVRAAVTVNQSLSSSGVISTSPGIGIFADAACTTA
jgi:hypothetical protein